MSRVFTRLYASVSTSVSGNRVFRMLSSNVATEGLSYSLSNDRTYYSCDGIGTATESDIVIADNINGIPVTRISTNAFEGCDTIMSVTIPDSVTFIEDDPFMGCTNLMDIVVSTHNTEYSSLNGDLYTKSGKTFIRHAPGSLRSEVTIPNTVTTIEDCAFSGCRNLTSATIPQTVTRIGASAFLDCGALTSLTISDGVTDIGGSAFMSCEALEYVNIPNSVRSIGAYAFAYCSSLKEITINDRITRIEDGTFQNCSKLLYLTIGRNVTSIGRHAFRGCSGLTVVDIPSNVTSIGLGAFQNCEFLDTITLPFIGSSVGCDEDTHFGYIFGAQSWQDNQYYVPDSLLDVTITGGSVVDDSSFCGCSNLAWVYLPDSITSIGTGAFRGCSWLESIFVPHKVTSIGDYAFADCSHLRDLTLGSGIVYIGYGAFSGCSSLAYNTDGNAYYLGNLSSKYVVLVKAISPSITSHFMPTGTRVICYDAFCNCSSLTSITIHNKVKSIGKDAFYECKNLKNVYFVGTQSEWNAIEVGQEGNESLYHATLTFK